MSKNEVIKLDEARAVLDAAQKERVEVCAEAIKQLLEKHQCALAAIPFITPQGTIGANISVQPTNT